MRGALVAAAVLAAAVALTGCKSLENVARGGKVVGDTLTVYSLLPQPGTGNARDFVDAEKLALFEADGMAGEFAVNFVSIDEGKRSALELRDALADPQVTALIGPYSSDVAMRTVPLFNAAGVLETTPGAGYAGFTEPVRPGEPERWQPSGRRTFARLAGDDIVQARAMLAAARKATGRKDPRVAIEQEPGPVADGLVAALHEAGARTVGRRVARRRRDLRRRRRGQRRRRRGRARRGGARHAGGAPRRADVRGDRAAPQPRRAPAGGPDDERPEAGLDPGAARLREALPRALRARPRPVRDRRLPGDAPRARRDHRGR